MRNTVVFAVALLVFISCQTKESSIASAADADKPHYEVITAASTATVDAGKDGLIQVEIKATDGYEFHKESPLKMTVAEAPGLAFGKLKFSKDDVKDVLKPVFKAPFKASKPGKYEVQADLHFVVCLSTICEIKRPTVKVPVEVK